MAASPERLEWAALEHEVVRLKDELARLETERRKLIESERMYRFAAEISGRLAWCADPGGRILKIGPFFASLTGIEDEQVLEAEWIRILHREDRARVLEQWSRCLETGEAFAAQFRIVLQDRSTRMVMARAVAHRDEEGRIARWYGSAEDLQAGYEAETARREAEARLRESEDLHRYTLELSEQIAWILTPDGTLTTLSPRFTELTGVPHGKDFMAAWISTLHPDERDQVLEEWTRAVAAGKPYRSEFRIRLADGSYRLFQSRAAPRRDEHGKIVKWYGTTLDIHEQRQADLARREAEERYRLAAMATNDAIWDCDLTRDIIEWGEPAAEAFDLPDPLGTTPGSWWEERIHPDDRERILKTLSQAIEEGKARWSATYRFRKGNGNYAEIFDRGFIIRNAGGTAVRAVGAMADLTERNYAEAEIRRMQSELVHVSRVSAMGTMASTLAHEINQPLTALTNYVRGARRLEEKNGSGSNPLLLEALDAAESGALRAGEIVRKLRELVSKGTVAIGVEHLPRLIEEAGVLAFVDENVLDIAHEVALDPGAKWVQADRIQIQQVLINLIRNAVEAVKGQPIRKIIVSASPWPDGMVKVCVADTGCGIAPEHMNSLFSQFMTTKKGGMGIGLPISRTIVEAHGGKIWGENRKEGGAVFCFTLKAGNRM